MNEPLSVREKWEMGYSTDEEITDMNEFLDKILKRNPELYGELEEIRDYQYHKYYNSYKKVYTIPAPLGWCFDVIIYLYRKMRFIPMIKSIN